MKPAYPRKRPKHDIELVWPSGSGTEIGVFTGDIDTLWDLLKKNHAMVHEHFYMAEVVEDGRRAIIVEGLGDTPISFAEEDFEDLEGLSIVIDDAVDPATVAETISTLVGDMVRFPAAT